MLFNDGNVCINVTQLDDEPREHCIIRGNYVLYMKPQNDKEYKHHLQMSLLYINWYKFGCSYGDKLTEQFKKYKKKK